MAEIQARSVSLFSWSFEVVAGGRPVATVEMARVRETGQFVYGGTSYALKREGTFSGEFLIEGLGGILATATKKAFARQFRVHVAGREIALLPENPIGSRFQLAEGERRLGHVSVLGLLRRHLTADLPEEIPIPVQILVLWLVVLLQRRGAAS